MVKFYNNGNPNQQINYINVKKYYQKCKMLQIKSNKKLFKIWNSFKN